MNEIKCPECGSNGIVATDFVTAFVSIDVNSRCVDELLDADVKDVHFEILSCVSCSHEWRSSDEQSTD